MTKRVAVLISGRGSNLEALIKATRTPGYPATITTVIADRPAAGLKLAEAAGIPTLIVDRGGFPTRAAFESAIDAHLAQANVDIVCLAGFMRILSADVVQRWGDRMINIHPSLLPSFPGLHTHMRAIAAGARIHGCTVHFVRTRADEGPIIIQAAVPVLGADTPETLADRVLEAEHLIYPEALRLVASGAVTIMGDVTVIEGASIRMADEKLISPAPPLPRA